jgi:hypothetical protein
MFLLLLALLFMSCFCLFTEHFKDNSCLLAHDRREGCNVCKRVTDVTYVAPKRMRGVLRM